MPFELNTYISPTTITGNYFSSAFDTGPLGGTDGAGQNFGILVTGVIGNPNALFQIQTSADGLNWVLCASDDLGPVNAIGTRNIHFATDNEYWRLAVLWQEQPSGGGSNNSSSLSSQVFNSSSSGGSASLTFSGGLTPSNRG
jgi:hypothetical protein